VPEVTDKKPETEFNQGFNEKLRPHHRSFPRALSHSARRQLLSEENQKL